MTVNLNELLSAGYLKNKTYTASGAIPSIGLAVQLNADGTVSTSNLKSVESVFKSGSVSFVAATYDSTNNKVVIAYSDGTNGNFGTAVVGTVNIDGTITFGTPVVFQSSQVYGYTAIAYDSTNNKIVIAYRNNATGYPTVVLGQVSGSSISFTTPTVIVSAAAGGYSGFKLLFDYVNARMILAFSLDTNLLQVYSLNCSGITPATVNSYQASATAITTYIDMVATTVDVTNFYYAISCMLSNAYGDVNIHTGYSQTTGVVTRQMLTVRPLGATVTTELFNPKLAFDAKYRKLYVLGTVSKSYISSATYTNYELRLFAISASLNWYYVSEAKPIDLGLLETRQVTGSSLHRLHFNASTGRMVISFNDVDNKTYIISGLVEKGFFVEKQARIKLNDNQAETDASMVSIADKVIYTFPDNSTGYGKAVVINPMPNTIGVSKTTAINGATVSVGFIGDAVTGLTGLRPMTDYFDTGVNGVLSITDVNAKKIGTAINDTTLFITG